MTDRPPVAPDLSPPGLRLDVWLWASRFFKTRAVAKQAIEAGRVKLGGQDVAKPAKLVRVGDVLQVRRGEERFEVEVLGLSDVRGPASVAQQLYREGEASIAARAAERAARAAERAGFTPPPTRPDKKARRQLEAERKKVDNLPPWFPR